MPREQSVFWVARALALGLVRGFGFNYNNNFKRISCKSRMELIVLTVNTTILKPLSIKMYFTAYIFSVYGRF